MTRAGRLTLIATILGSTIVFLDATVVNVALPAISDDLDTGLADQQWVVEAYLLALVSLLLVGGSLGDQFGRRRLFVLGLLGFAVTSALCAVAPGSELLIGARAAQGLAGALLVPGSLAILAATFEGAERGKAVGTWTAWTGIATVIGPAGGGALIEALSWRAIFWVNVPLIVFTAMLALHAVDESSDPGADRTIDWAGIVLSAAGLGGPVFALIQQPEHGWSDPMVYAPLIGGVLLFAVFLAWEARYRHSMLDLSLFRIRNFAVTNLETLIVYAGLIGAFFFVTIFLQQTIGYTALEAGLATTPISILLFVLSPRFGRFATSTGPRLPMAVGPIVGGVGLLLLTQVDAGSDYLTGVLPGIIVFGLGLSATVAPLTATALDSVEERHVGIASGINNGISRVAGLLAIAVLGAVIAGSFESTIDDRLGGATLSPKAQNAVAEAKDKPLGAAKTGGLSASEAATVDAAVTSGSEQGFHLGMGLAGALMIVGGAIAGVGIRNPRRREDRIAPLAAPAGECGRAQEWRAPGPVPGTLDPEPAPTAPDPAY
ncbi:MAG TPA: DHA2 family efflux MFS transporter permease subunit [Solirubrobacterales bacterium]|nr:DHA2 family efflux MFS transporter permease subunit [Solirubrobacterales bacterium]